MTLREPLPAWHCRFCRQPIDQLQLKTDPGATVCWECQWRLTDATEGRR